MPEAERRIAEALDGGRASPGRASAGRASAGRASAGRASAGLASAGLEELRRELHAPRALRDYGFTESDIPAAAQAILPAVPPQNPRPVTAGDLERLLRAAWQGADPAAADPAGADPAGAAPAGADPAGADPAGADPAGADP